MKNNITELVFVLDRSGSMAGLVDDTIGGFNSLIVKQKEKEGICLVTTVLFDTRYDMIHDRVPIQQIGPMTGEDYIPGGCTALLDAAGDTIRHIARIHKYARAEDVPENTVFVITTDGMENASRRFSAEEIRAMVEHEQEEYGWEFLFLGANIDAFAAAGALGIRAERTSNYQADAIGTKAAFDSLNEAVSCARLNRPISGAWKKDVEEDFARRQKIR